MRNSIYITEESLPWLLEGSIAEQRKLIGRLSEDSCILLISLVGNHYKSTLIPEEMSPLLRESHLASKYHNLFIEVSRFLTSRNLYEMCKEQSDMDKQTLYVAALAQKVNEGDPDAFKYLCGIAEAPERQEELRYCALTSLRMLPDKTHKKIRNTGKKTMRHILAQNHTSHQMAS